MTHSTLRNLAGLLLLAFLVAPVVAQPQTQDNDKPPTKQKQVTRPKFKWVNPPKQKNLRGVTHATFRSPSMDLDVGYNIYLPRIYKESPDKRFPVVYYLHGGRPGSESKSVNLATYIDKAIEAGTIPPTIYVFVNGGPVSHYNYPQIENGMGEDVFVKELIPYIDKTYRTIADRNGRGLEGFSQGGRGTSRIMFKHPTLFYSAAPGGGGYATEKRISENGGAESETLKFALGYNTWDLAKTFAKNPKPKFRILVFVGTKGFNYENNLAYMKYLTSLGIDYDKLIVPEAPHSAKIIYDKAGATIMKFHAESFRLAQLEKD